MSVHEWAARYARAWEEADPDAAAALFTEDATYRSDPFREYECRRRMAGEAESLYTRA